MPVELWSFIPAFLIVLSAVMPPQSLSCGSLGIRTHLFTAIFSSVLYNLLQNPDISVIGNNIEDFYYHNNGHAILSAKYDHFCIC